MKTMQELDEMTQDERHQYWISLSDEEKTTLWGAVWRDEQRKMNLARTRQFAKKMSFYVSILLGCLFILEYFGFIPLLET